MSAASPEGAARSEGIAYEQLLEADARPVPPFLREARADFLGDAPIDAARYVSLEFQRLENERLWPRVWQMVCRVEDLPVVGASLVYDIADRSFLVIRTAPDRIRAFYNSCLHRGRKLATADGVVERLRCPFHGFTWNIDGTLHSLPCRWDFPHLADADLTLPEARVDCWGGFVFLNMDPDAPALADFLGVLPEHFARWDPASRYKAVHVAQVLPANWKVVQEAFMESYHVIATHPQILPVAADANARYDVFEPHVSRNIMAFGSPSPHLGEGAVDDGAVVEAMHALWGRTGGPPGPGGPARARARLGAEVRAAFARAFAGDFEDACDAELLDAIVYNVFPNFAPWGGFAPNIVYRFRPFGLDVDRSIMDVMILKPPPHSGPVPPAATLRWLAGHERWSDVEELPVLGPVIEQDMHNLPHMQGGLRASASGKVQLGNYQELRIRHFHQTLERYLARTDEGEGTGPASSRIGA